MTIRPLLTARLLLLVSTVFGLAMMHTLGHAGIHSPTSHGAMPATVTSAVQAPAATAAKLVDAIQASTATAAKLVDAVRAPAAGAKKLVDAVRAPAAATEVVDAVRAPHCPGGDCGGHGAESGWSICLAVLGGLAMVVLLALALRTRRGPSAGLQAATTTEAPGVITGGTTLRSTTVLRI